jgi:hypothetical protein
LKDAFQANSKSTPKAADKSVCPTQLWDEQRHRIRHRSNVGASVSLVRKLLGTGRVLRRPEVSAEPHGLRKCSAYEGGLQEWKAAGLGTEKA